MAHPSRQPNFATNVNRAKTKRWVEAKSYSYDGDDWGDADEYDEYGGYNEPAPPPPKPTGLRQRGQSTTQSSQLPFQHQPPSQSDGRRGYGGLGGQPVVQPPQGIRSATNPQPRIDTNLKRSNSFERGDEARAFSAGGYQQGLPERGVDVRDAAIPGHRHEQNPPLHQNTAPYAVQSPEQIYLEHPQLPESSHAQQQPYPGRPRADSKQSQSDGQTYSLGDVSRAIPTTQNAPPLSGNRTDSLTDSAPTQSLRSQAQPQHIPNTSPLRMQGSSNHPEYGLSGASQAHRPPRKSSLSQQTQIPITNNAPDKMPTTREQPIDEPAQRERSSSDVGKPLPFVRPADIYRRMQEEKERERQSQESSRPSMDAINKEHNTDKPFAAQPRREGFLPPLQPMNEHAAGREPNNGDRNSSNLNSQTLASSKPLPSQGEARWEGLLPQIPDTSQPMLPDVARISRFDPLFLKLGSDEAKAETASSEIKEASTPLDTAQVEVAPSRLDTTLQHQPSAGFRSVVSQAFDQAPATPSSGTGSGLDRSISGSTDTRTPPVSRGPSSATDNIATRLASQRALTPPAKIMDTVPEERRMSSGSGGTPKAERPSSHGALKGSPKTFIPGHRRDLSTPSPDNSPARTPAIENTAHLQSPQEAEMAVATPISPPLPPKPDTQPHQVHEGSQAQPPSLPLSIRMSQQDIKQPKDANRPPPSSSRSASPIKTLANSVRDREGSPSSSRVKDIADRFESVSRRDSDQSLSEKPQPMGGTSPRKGPEAAFARPPADRLDSFRPQLPGGWNSYVSSSPSAAATQRNALGRAEPHPLVSASGQQPLPGSPDDPATKQPIPQQVKAMEEGSSVSPTQDPFGALSAAGSALVGAFAATTSTPPSRNKTQPHEDNRTGCDNIVPDFDPARAPPSSETTPRQAPPKLSSLDTERKPQYESDRLRREIVKSLSPNKTSEPTTADTESSLQISPDLTSVPTAQRSGAGLERPTIPNEYESYWNDSSSAGSTRSISRRRKAQSLEATQPTSAPVEQLTPLHLRSDHHDNPIQDTEELDQDEKRPALTSQPYSWERPGSALTSTVDTSTIGDRTSEPSDITIGHRFAQDPSQSRLSDEPVLRTRSDSLQPFESSGGATALSLQPEPDPGFSSQSDPSDVRVSEHDDDSKQRHPSDGSNPTADAAFPSRSMAASGSETAEDSRPFPREPDAQPKILGFREILALKTPEERIKAFNHARQQYANTNSGLQHWLKVKGEELGSFAPGQGSVLEPTTNLQQSTASSGHVNLQPGPASHPGGLSQGSSPASTVGARLNRQQLQSKGKDLLKDANVLSGKANVAAKGLFMKGRNKLRGADKV